MLQSYSYRCRVIIVAQILSQIALKKYLELTMMIAKLLVVALLLAPVVRAQEPVDSTKVREVRTLLRQFLVDAGDGDRAGFDRFFAADLIYTGSNGAVRTKAGIMKSVGGMKPTPESKTVYTAEDVTVHSYTDAAIVAFRLVARTQHLDGKTEVTHYRNTGTFLLRNGRWQVVAWQATKAPEVPTAK